MKEQQVTSAELARYLVHKAPAAAVQTIASCASDGTSFWKPFFSEGIAGVIANDVALERRFFKAVCFEAQGSASLPILGAYLQALPEAAMSRLFSESALRAKTHPIQSLIPLAVFETDRGRVCLEMLDMFVRAGASEHLASVLAQRSRKDDLLRACRLPNAAFLRVVLPHVPLLPQKIVDALVQDDLNGVKGISELLKTGHVALSTFTSRLGWASPQVYSYLAAVEARMPSRP